MKPNLLRLLLLISLAVVLVACGGGTTTTEEPEATEAAPEATEAPAEEPTPEVVDAFTCEDAIGCVDIAAGDPIHIAWIQTVSGATAPLGTDNVRGVEIAIDDLGGELLGHPIELTGEDSLCSQEGGQAAGTRIAADPTIVGVVGTTCSSEARGAMPLLAEAGMVMISPSNTNPDLTNPDHPDHHPGYFRTAHNDLFQGRVAAEFAYNQLGVRTAATIHDGSPYAESLQQVFADVFTELGGTVTVQTAVNVGDTDMQPVLTSIAADAPELLYFPIFEPEGDFIAAQKCDVAGLENTVMMGADGLLIDTMPEASGECAVGMYLSGPFVQGEAYDAFVAKYTETYGEVPISGFHAHAYDGANMIFQALQEVAVVDAEGTLHIGRQALRDAMYGITDFNGLTGVLTCDANGDCATGEALAIFQLTEGEVVDGNWPPAPSWQPGQTLETPEETVAGPFECTDAIGCVTVAPGDPIHIAWIATVSGATAPLGTDNNRGVEIAIADRGGELLGHPIELSGEDSLCSQEGGQAAGTRIAADPTIVGVVGTTCSSEARGAMPLLAEAGMVMISPSNTNPDLTNPEHPDHHTGYFRTAHNDLFQGRVAAEFAYNELGVTTAATIHDGSPYAESLQQVFADVFVELGGTITVQTAINVGDTDMQPVLTSIAADAPGILYFPIFEPESDFIAAQKCDVAGLENTVMMSADGSLIDTFPEAAGECADGMYLSGPFVQGDAYDAFVAKYVEAYGENPVSGFHAHAYDGANMIFAAIEQVAAVDADGTVHIPRQALIDAMYATTDYQGLTGVLSCDANGDCATGEALAIFQLSSAEIVDGNWPPPPFWQPGQ